MATITVDTFLDGGVARTAGETMAIGNGAKLTVRTDTRVHANAPASFTGSLGNPTFTDIGGELLIDATAVRWMAFSGGSGTVPAIGTSVTRGGVSGYLLGVWASLSAAPSAVGAAMPATGFLKFREVTGGPFTAGVLTGITATADAPDVAGWIEAAFDAATNFVVGRVGRITTRGDWFYLTSTNGSIGQQLQVPSSSSAATNNFCPGVWVETSPGSNTYEFWTGLASSANGWRREALGYAEGFTDARAKFVKTFGNGIVQFGETATLAATYATVAGQASTYASIAIAATYTWVSDVVTVDCGATAHNLDTGLTVRLDFTSGGGVDADFVVTVLDAYRFTAAYAGSGASGNVTVRPGITVTFTAHGVNAGESVYCDFTSGTGTDGTYVCYGVTSANAYLLSYPHAAALTAGNVTAQHTLQITATAHGHAIGNEVYCDFTSGAGIDGRFIIKGVAANTMNVNYPFSAAIASSNVTLKWTIGNVPASGCKVRIGNVLLAECATGSRQTNSVPNATVASRPEFNTTAAGAIDLEYIYAWSLNTVFSQPYSVRLVHCALQDTVSVSECATAVVMTDVGVGQYSAQNARALQLTSNFAGGTVAGMWAYRANLTSSGHASEVLSCKDFAITALETGIVNYARSTGSALNISGSQNITVASPVVMNGNITVVSSVNVGVTSIDYSDRFIGRTNATTPLYCMTIAVGCDRITLDGVTFGRGTVPDCHPYAGVVSTTSATNIKARNVGASGAYLQTGVWAPNFAAMGSVLVTGGNNITMKLQRVFVGALRTSLFTTINSDKDVTYEQVLSSTPHAHGAKAPYNTTVASLNAVVRGVRSGSVISAAQTSVYGTDFMDMIRGTNRGFLILAMNEATTETASAFTVNAGVVKFNSAGGVEMRAIGAQATWEMRYFAQGHTAFQNVTPTMSGGTIGNYTLEYQIDVGSGWSAWKAMTGANLSAETLSPTTGFKLKIRITTAVTNATAITYLRLDTVTTAAAHAAIAYPLDVATVTIAGCVAGSRVKFVKTADSTILSTAAESSGSATLVTDYIGAITITVRKASAAPYYKEFVTQVTSVADATTMATALQQLDQ